MGFNLLVTLIVISIVIVIFSLDSPKKSGEFTAKHIPFIIIIVTMLAFIIYEVVYRG